MYSLLIVDDEPLIRRGIKSLLSLKKYGINNIYEANNGKEAIKIFLEKAPNIVLLDINMPFKDGISVAKEIKNINKETKIVIITGYDYFEYAQKALKIGVEDYILKPVSKNDIEEILSKIIEKLNKEKIYIETEKIIQNIKNSKNELEKDSYKNDIFKKMEENIDNINFNLNFLADELNLSSGYLSILFKNLFGIPFQDYLNNIRMEKAKILLLTTELKNHEIGELVGFNNVYYFNSKFKKTFGIAPKEFKKNIIGKDFDKKYEEIK